jgi:hypothetical protein
MKIKQGNPLKITEKPGFIFDFENLSFAYRYWWLEHVETLIQYEFFPFLASYLSPDDYANSPCLC